MMLVSELPATLLVWVVGSAARVGYTYGETLLCASVTLTSFALAESLFLAGRLKA